LKVFLIYVRDEDYYQLLPPELIDSRFDENRVQIMAFPPLGIETLAPIIREHGHDVHLFDTCHPEMKEDNIVLALTEDKPDIIALSFLSTTSYPAAQHMAQKLKQESPNTPIIFGGVFATMNAKNILADCPYVDFIGVGEGEELLPDFLENLNEPENLAGLVWRSGDEIVKNEDRPLVSDLDKFPYPDRTTLPIDYIESMPLDVPAVLSLDRFCTIQTSRGCPYKCIYCDIPALSAGKWRYRSPEHVLGEMQQLNDRGYRSIYFTDDHFLLHQKRIEEICQGIIDRKFEFNWGCEGRVDSKAVDQLPLMAKANCNFLAFGVESGSQKVLDRLKKNQSLDQINNAVSEAKRHGIGTTHGFFMVGSPGETVEDIIESFRFAAKLKLDTFGFNRLCTYRGTPLWQEYVDQGIIEDEKDWYKWFKCSDIDATVLPGEVVNKARQKGYLILFTKRIFMRPIQTFKLIKTFSRNMRISTILKLLWSPFRKRTLTRIPELPAWMIEKGMLAPKRETA